MGVAAIATTVLGGLGAGLSAYGTYQAGAAKSEAAAYQAQVAANNAAIARQNEVMDIQAGEAAAVNKGLETRAKVGEQKVQQGAAGIDVNTGSAADVRAGTAQMGLLDALTIRSNAAKKAYADEVEATSDTAQSKLDIMESQQDKEAGEIGAAGSLLTGASTVGSNYMRYQAQFGTS